MDIPYTADSAPLIAHKGDAGSDLRSSSEVVIPSKGWVKVPTGLSIALPEGYAAFVMPRSGLAARHGITVLNAPGVVDAGYRGEIQVVLINHSFEPYTVEVGAKIAQLVIMPVITPTYVRHMELDETERGSGGFGSTGYGVDTETPSL